jgi:hypothetical protein
MHLPGRIRAAADRVTARLTLVGADPDDDADLAARKALLVLISVLILPVAALWGALYLAFGSPVGVVPLVYFGILLGAIAVFSRTRDFSWLLRVGQVDILLAPTLSMIPLGGFLNSGGVGLWGILAPLAALVFSDVGSAGRWYVAYLLVFLGSGIAGEIIGPIWPPLPGWFTTTMLALNIAVGGTIVFTLLAVFASQRRDALAALRQEQAKAENLLLNILPRSIADKLKAQTQRIADQFESASILFADVVDFTPWSERLPPAEVVGYLDLDGELIGGALSDTSVGLSWQPSVPARGRVIGYRVLRDGKPVGQYSATSVTLTNLAASTTYTFTVTAVDGLGYLSDPAQVSVRTEDPVPTTGHAYAFLLASTGQSFRDFEAHYQQIGTVSPTYYDCDPQANLTGSDDQLITGWAKARAVSVLPRFNCQRDRGRS